MEVFGSDVDLFFGGYGFEDGGVLFKGVGCYDGVVVGVFELVVVFWDGEDGVLDGEVGD